jgi:hypothetical protein
MVPRNCFKVRLMKKCEKWPKKKSTEYEGQIPTLEAKLKNIITTKRSPR